LYGFVLDPGISGAHQKAERMVAMQKKKHETHDARNFPPMNLDEFPNVSLILDHIPKNWRYIIV